MADFRIIPFVAVVRIKELRSLARRAGRRLFGIRRSRPADLLPRTVPRTIWMYWAQGEAAAPPLVRACIASWRAQNPGWQVRVLDRDSAPGAIEMPMTPDTLPVQSFADLLRLRLLHREGGVWADATLFCLHPLDTWLPPLAQKGFFCYLWTDADWWFIWPNVRRVTTNWFLAAAPGDRVVATWEAASFDYWRIWRRRGKPHVYYWPHVLFEYLALSDGRFRRAWRQMPRIGAYTAHLVHDHVMRGGDPEPVRAALAGGAAPVQKLRWNWTPDQIARAAAVLDGLQGVEAADALQAADKRDALAAATGT